MKTIRDINDLLPVAQKACTTFLNECSKAGLNIFITETYRPQERQNELYEQGRTKPGNIVTWTKNSRHTSRLAWDIACNGTNLYDVKILEKAGSIAKKLGITWGGDWSTPDRPHFEVTINWKMIKEEEEMEQVKIYNKIEETPAWCHEALNYYYDNKAIADKNNLLMTLESIRILVIVYRVLIKKGSV